MSAGSGRAVAGPSLAFGAALALLALGSVVAGSAAGPVLAGGAGVLVLGLALTLRLSTDRLMSIAVGALILTVTWNGIRIGGGALGDAFMLLAFLCVVIHLVLSRRAPLLPMWIVFPAAGFLLAALLSVIFPQNHDLANQALVQQESLLFTPGYLPPRSDLAYLVQFELSFLLVPLLVAIAATTPQRVRHYLDLWTVGASINALVGVLDLAGVAHLAPNPIAGSRSSGLTIHPNYLALTAVMAIPPALLWIGRSRRWTGAGVAALAALLGGVYASGSRAGAVAAVIALSLTAVALPRLRRAIMPVLPFIGMTLVVVLAFTKVGSQVAHQIRLGGGDQSASGSDIQRSADAHLALRQISQRPLEGVGFAVIQDAHDIYLQVLAAGGAIAMVSFLLFVGGLAKSGRRGWLGGHREEVTAVGMIILVWLVNGIFDDQLADKYLYIVPGLMLAIAQLSGAANESLPTHEGDAVAATPETVLDPPVHHEPARSELSPAL